MKTIWHDFFLNWWQNECFFWTVRSMSKTNTEQLVWCAGHCSAVKFKIPKPIHSLGKKCEWSDKTYEHKTCESCIICLQLCTQKLRAMVKSISIFKFCFLKRNLYFCWHLRRQNVFSLQISFLLIQESPDVKYGIILWKYTMKSQRLICRKSS